LKCFCYDHFCNRSGKSSYAQQHAKKISECPIYVATARQWDDDFKRRIVRHQHDRGTEWTSYEIEKYVSTLEASSRVIMIDCVTLWLTNFFIDHHQNIELALKEFKAEIDGLEKKNDNTYIIVSNEIGMGVHAETEIGRKFVDLQGWANQYIAAKADEVYFMVSGIPWKIKPAR
jgi:adenosylcobinamide kinase/adenosylcobinamide-phosphate guanylyltransferase